MHVSLLLKFYLLLSLAGVTRKKKSWPNSKAIKRETAREDGGCFSSSSMKEMPEGISEDSDFKVSVLP